MAENSKIEWCDHTFNPWMGCQKVSAGCQHCYAEDQMDRRWGKVKWGPEGPRKRTSDAYWRKPYKWNEQAKAEGRRYRVFCASLADVFEDRPELEPWRADLLHLIQQTPQLDWLLLTKRPENVNRLVEQATGFSDAEMWFHSAPQVWIGTSVEDQAAADERIPALLQVPATVRFLSCEPLLGPVEIVDKPYWAWRYTFKGFPLYIQMHGPAPAIQWVIVGGESGRNARPMHPDWVRSLRDQCQRAGVTFHFKQWGEWVPWIPRQGNPESKPIQHVMEDGSDYSPGNYSSPLQSMIRVGKKAAGRLLDGREWNEVPE